MISMTLYKREMKGSVKLLVIFGAVITLYVSLSSVCMTPR